MSLARKLLRGADAATPLGVSNTASQVFSNNANDYQITNAAIGAAPGAGERRWIVVCAFRQNQAFSGCTIGGNAATSLGTVVESARNGEMWILEVPTGTTATVICTGAASAARCGISVYRVISGPSTNIAAAYASNTDITHSSGTLNLSLNVPAGGVVIGLKGGNDNGLSGWSGITEDVDADMESAAFFSTASLAFAAAQTPLAITITDADTTPTGVCALAVSLGP